MLAIFMFPSKCTDQSRRVNLFNSISRIKKLQANHGPKVVMYFCLSVDKSFYKPLLYLPAAPGLAGLGCANFQSPRVSAACAALLLGEGTLGARFPHCTPCAHSEQGWAAGCWGCWVFIFFSLPQSSVSFCHLPFIPLCSDSRAMGMAVSSTPQWSRHAIPAEWRQPHMLTCRDRKRGRGATGDPPLAKSHQERAHHGDGTHSSTRWVTTLLPPLGTQPLLSPCACSVPLCLKMTFIYWHVYLSNKVITN